MGKCLAFIDNDSLESIKEGKTLEFENGLTVYSSDMRWDRAGLSVLLIKNEDNADKVYSLSADDIRLVLRMESKEVLGG